MLCLTMLAAGCAPTCASVCRKAMSCELDSPRTSTTECEDTCTHQLRLYQDWDDEELQDAFDEQRQCIADATCDEIADGVCYDEALYVF
jgi:hypothetical protein